jgi:hypothetical protein
MTATEGYSLDQRELSVSQTSKTVATMRYKGRAQLIKVLKVKTLLLALPFAAHPAVLSPLPQELCLLPELWVQS